MLYSLADCPTTVGKDISLSYWALGMAGNAISIAFNSVLVYYFYDLLVNQHKMSGYAIALWFAGITSLITATLYIYYVYLVDLGSRPSKKN